jgi:hypothetical protein
MGPIEILWATVLTFFVFIALVRGYHKELGVTIVLLATIWALKQAEIIVTKKPTTGLYGSLYLALNKGNPLHANLVPESNALKMYLFLGALVLIVLAAYRGRTISLSGNPTTGHKKGLLDIAVGAVNGYLFAGTAWYYMAIFNYPFPKWMHVDMSKTTHLAKVIVQQFLPPTLLDDKIIIGAVVLLVILGVRK